MRKYNKYFDLIVQTADYSCTGDDVNYKVIVDDEYKEVLLIFQGSSSKEDWKNNFDFPIKPYKNGNHYLRYASGWCNAWKSANDTIIREYTAACESRPEYNKIIAGYSYGGAMALLAAEDFNYRTGKKANVITFGAPKPLWGKATQNRVRMACGAVWQFSHVNDVVTYCPPLPGYCRITTDWLGDNFNVFELFKPYVWHQIYGDEKLYEG